LTAGSDEVELKYAVRDARALERFLDDGSPLGLRAGPWRTVDVEDRYLDTADGAIARGGYAARLRRTAAGTLISLKRNDGEATTQGARHRRAEIEAPATSEADPDDWPASPARTLVMQLSDGSPLVERFTIRQRRRERDLHGRGGSAVMSLDEVDVRRDGRRLGRSTELEVELKRGRETLLQAIAADLEPSGLVEPEARSKEARAQELVDGTRRRQKRARPAGNKPGARPAGDKPGTRRADSRSGASRPPRRTATKRRSKADGSPGVEADDRLSEAGRKVLAFHLRRMRSLEDGVRTGRHIEDVHKMRVATRRMRAVWRVFRDAYRKKVARRYVDQLAIVGSVLGAVRDLDVLLEGIERDRAGVEVAEALEPYVKALRERRETAASELDRLVGSATYARFVDDYESFVATTGLGARKRSASKPQRVRDMAPSRVWLAYERMRSYDDVVESADVATLHALRIEAKRLRYTLEAFAEVMGPEVDELIAGIVALQDHLGELHDATVAAGLARDFLDRKVKRTDDATRRAVTSHLHGREARVDELRRDLDEVWRPLLAPGFRRRLAGAVGAF
jgi:CHAD domain-containing protein